MGSLVGVYGRARYCVGGEAPFVLRVGQFSDALQGVFWAYGCQTAAFLTAANPGGVKISDTENLSAERLLARDVAALQLPVLPGIGLDEHEHSDWPGERSLLVLGMGHQEAIRLGRVYRQLALLWCPPSAVPELQMLER